jgi:hypothetical protein
VIPRVTRNRVGQRQIRVAALTGPRERHRQRGSPQLADLGIDPLRRQQHVGVKAKVGERGVDERLHELAG